MAPLPLRTQADPQERPNIFRISDLARVSTPSRSELKFLPARLISKLSIDMAERKGLDLRRLLDSADLFRDSAIARALLSLNMPAGKSIASLSLITLWDHLRGGRARLRFASPLTLLALLRDFTFRVTTRLTSAIAKIGTIPISRCSAVHSPR